MTMPQIQFRMIEDDLDPEVVTAQTIEIINRWLTDHQITQNDVQKAMLLSHVKAMVERAKTREKLPEVDPSLFDELSEQSLMLARKTVKLFNRLSNKIAHVIFLLAISKDEYGDAMRIYNLVVNFVKERSTKRLLNSRNFDDFQAIVKDSFGRLS
ncbi:PRD domain protein [Gilliamella apis SCGC AB-598-P17]|nr:PRD domain protein [Gilliamella apis SCGC AB-598-P17]KES15011.1 PRD domain protein [Gilliamella apis SCGC AB-598-P17]KES15098.1 PRD domain protein [Gilliamella apis SCGC AB-598-P17]